MDRNKLVLLKQIGFSIPKHCGICKHGVFSCDGNATFGTCTLYKYKHDKHTGLKGLSVHRAGSCPTGFALNEDIIRRLITKDWEQFIDRRLFTRNNRHKQKTHI